MIIQRPSFSLSSVTKLSADLKMILLIIGFSVLALILAFKGSIGNGLLYQSDIDTAVGTPFESTNSTSRYLLVQALVDNGSFFFTDAQARLAAPDLVKYKDRYFSIFTPGISLIAAPFYWLGKQLGIPQVLAFSSTIVFAVLNVWLISQLAARVGIDRRAGLLAGFLFLIGSNAFAYALTLTQHTVTVTLLLLAFLNLTYPRTIRHNFQLGLLYGLGIVVDIPNAFLLFPVMLYAAWCHFQVIKNDQQYRFSINLKFILLGLGALPLLLFFAYYNYSLTGSLTKIGQFIGRYDYPREDQLQQQPLRNAVEELEENELSAPRRSGISLPFKTRNQIEGGYILLVSTERAWWFYSPILLVGFLGLFILHRRTQQSVFIVMSSVILLNVLLYAMFGDPWGGWSFGARYLIPAGSLLAVGVAGFIYGTLSSRWRWLAFAVVAVLSIYSIRVNTLGALTTAAVPPKVEAESLPNPIPHTYQYNLQLLEQNRVSALVYNSLLTRHMTADQYFRIVWLSLSALAVGGLAKYYWLNRGYKS